MAMSRTRDGLNAFFQAPPSADRSVCSFHALGTALTPEHRFNTAMICAALYRPLFIKIFSDTLPRNFTFEDH